MTIHRKQHSRRSILWWICSLVFLWPLLRFVGFRVPTKPIKVKVTDTLPANGVITQKEFILFDRGGKCWALSRRCTHLGCKINYHETEDLLECPCHQSRFAIDSGAVIHGPAKSSLLRFHVEKLGRNGGYAVTIKG